MSGVEKEVEVLTPFTVDASAALPIEVCAPDARKSVRQGARPRNVVPLPSRAFGRAVAEAHQPGFAASLAASLGRKPPPARLLDGFVLLEASAVDLPEEATKASVESQDLAGIVLQDMAYFTQLRILNLGDNKLGLGGVNDVILSLGLCLPQLVELRLHCNNISAICELTPPSSSSSSAASEDGGGGSAVTEPTPLLPRLEVLDLSYNAVTPDAIAQLAALPSLRELDLTCNTLTALPDMSAFPRLEVLVLQRNRLSNDDDLANLARCPKLRELNLAFNYLHRIPASAVADRGCFSYLEWLNIENNYFSSEQDLLFLVKMPNLRQAVLFGNPVTFRAKQEGREPGDFADDPRKRGGGGGGVEEGKDSGASETALVSLEAERAKGKVVNLVTDDPRRAERRPKALGSYANFRVTKVVEKSIPSNAEWREAGNKFLFDADSDDEEEDGGGGGRGALKDGKAAEEEEEEEEDDEFYPEDYGIEHPQVPSTFITAGAGLHEADPKGDSVKLRSALTALRHALKHPLTDDTDQTKKSYEKTTASMKSRRQPTRPYVPRSEHPQAAGAKGVPIATMGSVIRGPPGSQPAQVREIEGSRPVARRPAGSRRPRPRGDHGFGDGDGERSRVQHVLHATAEAKASVDAMEDMLDKLTFKASKADAAKEKVGERSVQGFLAKMDDALKSFV